jgi:hypothetical protein
LLTSLVIAVLPLTRCDALRARGGVGAPSDDNGLHRFVEKGNFFPLETINAVTSGKETRALRHSHNERVPADCVFTFGSSAGISLELQSDQANLQQLWLGGLKHVLNSH